jgi:hypothetical protein
MNAAICCVCKCSVDTSEPLAIIGSDYAHLDCADEYDSRDLGSIDLPERVGSWQEDYADAVCVSLTKEL